MRQSHAIVLATTNLDKWLEFKELFNSYEGIEIDPANELVRNADKIAQCEIYDNYLENAVAKARLINQACHFPALGDDTGLEVDALSGGPGARSHRYAIPKAGQSQSEANITKLLGALTKAPAPRRARFVTTLALVLEGIMIHSTGVLEGTIAESPKGSAGFGYDSVFILNETVWWTLAQLDLEEKNKISHRARALKELMEQIKNSRIVLAKP